MIKIIALLMAIVLAVAMASCDTAATIPDSLAGTGTGSTSSPTTDTSTGTGSGSSTVGSIDASSLFTARDLEIGYEASSTVTIRLEGTSASCADRSVKISGGTVTITSGGSYLVSGTLAGQLVVDAAKTDDVQLVLSNAQITNSSSAALYVKQADKVVVTLDSGSANTLATTGSFVDIDDNSIDGAVFSKDDLTLNGNGSLTVSCATAHGIVSKDELAITGGNYTIVSEGHAISGKDNVKIASGSFEITAQKDGIHSENKDDATQGFVYIGGGSFAIEAVGDAVSAATIVQVDGGSLELVTGGGSSAVLAADASAKGIKATTELVINAGTFTLDCADDALHSNGNVVVSGGSFEVATGDDGVHADSTATVSGGSINITQSYEGIEGLTVDITGGDISIVSSDDGINAAGGNDSSGFGGRAGKDSFGSGSGAAINISGGVTVVDAQGDGVDSNGSLTVSGGELYVTGPHSSGNSALDCDGNSTITGGIVVATGPSGMAQGLGSGSTQGVIAYSLSGNASGTVSLTDSSGKLLASYTPTRQYSWVLVSTPDIVQGASYTLAAGSTTQTIEMTSLQYSNGGTGMGDMGGMGGGKGTTPPGTSRPQRQQTTEQQGTAT